MKIAEGTEIVSDLASQQWGLFTAAQAREAGVPGPLLGRLVERGALVRIRHGVYAAAATPLTEVTEIRAQWLAIDPKTMAAERATDDAVVSLTAAASLYQVGDLPVDTIDFTVPSMRRSRQPGVRFHVAEITTDEIQTVEGLPVTSIPRTIADLLAHGYEPNHILDIAHESVARGLASGIEIALGLELGIQNAANSRDARRQAHRYLLGKLLATEPQPRTEVQRAVDDALAPLISRFVRAQEELREEMACRSSPTHFIESATRIEFPLLENDQTKHLEGGQNDETTF